MDELSKEVFRQTAVLAAVGRITKSIAHDVNSALNYLQGNIHFLAQYLVSLRQLVDLHEQALRQISQEANQANQAIQANRETADIEYVLEDSEKVMASMQRGCGRIRASVNAVRTFYHLDDHADVLELDLAVKIARELLDSKIQGRDITIIERQPEAVHLSGSAIELGTIILGVFAAAVDSCEKSSSLHLESVLLKGRRIEIRCSGQAEETAGRALVAVTNDKTRSPQDHDPVAAALLTTRELAACNGGALRCHLRPAGEFEIVVQLRVAE